MLIAQPSLSVFRHSSSDAEKPRQRALLARTSFDGNPQETQKHGGHSGRVVVFEEAFRREHDVER